MAYQVTQSNDNAPAGSGFTVFDGPPDGKTAMKIQTVEDLASYAGFLNIGMSDAINHATQNGWLDTPTANQWIALIPQAPQTAVATTLAILGSEVESGLDSVIAGVKNATVGEIAFFLGLGVLAWLAVRKPKED